jgi:hypothetical protein
VTVRIQAVVLGPNTGGQGPNTSPDLARTGSDGVAEVHKRQAAARVCAAFSSRSTARAFASVEARLFPRIHRSGRRCHTNLDRRGARFGRRADLRPRWRLATSGTLRLLGREACGVK